MEKTPLEKHGKLSVRGRELTDRSGEPVMLYGFSTHGISWYGEYVSLESFRTLRDSFGTNCVRIALYPHEYHGYCAGGDKAELMEIVKKAVGYADELGIYIIIDWHVLNELSPNVYAEEAERFFEELSREFADRSNVLYEICNEPNGTSDWADITAYADRIIPVIRKNTDAVIIVGTPNWSQEIDKALSEPLGFSDIMYSLHFYAGTHGEDLRQRAEECLEKGLPVFVSEFNITDASGRGELDFEEGGLWMELVKKYGLSNMCWALCASGESCAVIDRGCEKLSGWEYGELSEAGKWVTDRFREFGEST